MSDTQILSPPPTALLKQAHDRVRDLFARFDALPDAERPDAIREIVEALQTHINIEEALFYPALLGWESESARKGVDEALEDHRRIRDLLDGAERVSVEELRGFVLGHFELEEERVFPRARLLPLENQWELSRGMERLRIFLENLR